MLSLIFLVLVMTVPMNVERDSLWVSEFTNETGGTLESFDEEVFFTGFHSSLSVRLVRNFKVVERDKLGVMSDEITLSDDAWTSKETRVKLGRLTGAKYLLTGSIVAFDESTLETNAHNIRMTKKVTILVVTYKLVDIESGELHWGGEVEVEDVNRSVEGRSSFTRGLIRSLSRKCADKISKEIKSYLAEKKES